MNIGIVETEVKSAATAEQDCASRTLGR